MMVFIYIITGKITNTWKTNDITYHRTSYEYLYFLRFLKWESLLQQTYLGSQSKKKQILFQLLRCEPIEIHVPFFCRDTQSHGKQLMNLNGSSETSQLKKQLQMIQKSSCLLSIDLNDQNKTLSVSKLLRLCVGISSQLEALKNMIKTIELPDNMK